MKDSDYREINGVKVRFNRLYNPNRFNGLDAALAYIVALVAFIALPTVFSLCFKNLFVALYKYDVFAYMIVNTLVSQSIIFLVAFAFCGIKKVSPFNGGGYEAKWDGVQIMMGVLIIMGVMLTFYGAHITISENFGIFFNTGTVGLEENYSDLYVLYALIYYIMSAVFPAVIEEMLFRGVIMRGLEQFGGAFAIVCSAVMFSLMHGSFSQMLLQFIGGLAIGAIVMLTKNWLIGSFLHMFNNAFAVVYALVLESPALTVVGSYIQSMATAVSIILGVSFLIISSIYYIGMFADKIKREANGNVEKDKFRRKVYYAYKCGEQERLIEAHIIPDIREKSEEDIREFSVFGKYRKLNVCANSIVSYILLGVGIALAVIGIFI